MAQLQRYYCFCEGQPVGAPLTELEAWLGDGDGRFNGQHCSLEQLEQLLRQIVVEWSEDLLLLLALPERFASVQNSIVKAVNHRRCHTVCIVLIFDEEGTPESMPGEFPRDFLLDIKPTSFNKNDKWQARRMLPYRGGCKAEFCFLAVPNLGDLLRHWKTIQSTSKSQDLSSFLREASKYLKKPLEMTEMTGLASTVVMFPSLCDGCGSLDTAIRAGHLTCLQHLLERGGSYPNTAESEFSPLHLAVLQAGQRKGPQMELYEKMAQLLIFAKHDPGCLNSRGITPLHWAAGYGKAPLVATMLHWTATGLFMRDATGKMSKEELQLASAAANVQDQNGRTALYRAVMHGHEEVVRWLVLMHADCNISDVHQSTPLHFAIHQNREQLVRLLLEHNARVDRVDADDRLPLHLLAGARKQQGEEQMKILELLLQNPKKNPEFIRQGP